MINGNLQLSQKINIPYEINTTTKGNGTINLNGLIIRVFDRHDDGALYKDDYLNIELDDLNSDGISELVFTGVLKHTGYKESDPVYLEPITTIYKLDCSTGNFIETQKAGSYSIEISNSQKTSIHCP